MDNYAVKFFDEEKGIIEGLGIPYHGPLAGKDLQGEYFSDKTDFISPFFDGKAVKSMKALYHHGLDPDIKDMPIGDVIDVEEHPEGKWIKVQLDKANKYYQAIKWLVQHGKLSFSSGAIPEGVQKTADGFIAKWPWREMSSTPAPANPLAQIEGIKTAGEMTLTAVLEKIKQENESMNEESVKSVPASPAADNVPNVPIKPDPAVSAEANGHVPGKTVAAPAECACKAIKCQSCGKDVQWPEDVVKQLQALGQSVQTVLTSIGATPQTSEANPMGDRPAKPSMPPSENQGMSPENHEGSPDASPKPEGPPAEKPSSEPEKPGEKEPDEDDKKPVKTEMAQTASNGHVEGSQVTCAKCGMSMEKCKCKTDSAKAIDIQNSIKTAVEEATKSLKERIAMLEALPITNGPAKSVKAVDNPRMDSSDGQLDDAAREKFYDEMSHDTTINFPSRQAAALKAQELSLKRTIAKGPQPLHQ